MKRWFALSLLGALAAVPAGAQTAPEPGSAGVGVLLAAGAVGWEAPEPITGPLTLEAALGLALSQNPRLEIARSYVLQAQAGKRGARAEALPRATFNGTGQFQGPAVSISGPPGSGVSGSFQPDRQATLGLDFEFPLYTAGRVTAGKRRAGAQEQAALARLEAEGQALVLDTTEAYLNVLDAREQLELAAALKRLDTERLRVARIRENAGLGIPLEVSVAEADLAASTQREIEVQARLRQAAAALNVLMGQPAATRVELTPILPRPAMPPSALLAAVQQRQMQDGTFLEERPDLKALRADIRIADAGYDQARANRRPLVMFRTNLTRRVPETLLGGFAWSLGASLLQTLFDAGRSRAQVESARAEQSRAGATLADAELRADGQVEQARASLEAAEKRLAAEEARIEAARVNLRTSQRRLEAGLAAEIVVTEAQTVLTRAETDALSARYEIARARVRLAYVLGRAYPDTLPALAAQN